MVIDVTEQSFATDVLERSRTNPVVVDFWASWCGPCRTLGPILEAAAAAREGEMLLAKVDVDANPGLQMRYGIRGIPAVKAFRDGSVVSEFTGALPKPQVERFLDALLPSRADRLAATGDEASLRAAVEDDPGHAGARVALARLVLGRGAEAEAETLLRPVGHDPVAAGLLARLELARAVRAGLDGTAPAALSALERGDSEAALAALVDLVRRSRAETRELARRVAIGVFAEAGEDDPVTRRYRPELAAALF